MSAPEPTFTLTTGQRRFNSWGLRPWVLLKTLQIPFVDEFVPVEGVGFNTKLLATSPSGLLPLLTLSDGTRIWDSLAIMEYLHDSAIPGIWPSDRAARTLARCVAFEMHSGFPDVRAALSFNMGYQLLEPLPLSGKVAQQIARIESLWRECRERFGAPSGAGPFLFGAFCAADAMYCPVAFRFFTYRVTLQCPVAEAYAQALRELPAMKEWAAKALTEEDGPTIEHYDAGIVKLGARKL